MINGHTHFPSAQHGAGHSPPLPPLHQRTAPYLKPICDNGVGFSKLRLFLRSNWRGDPLPEEAPGQCWGRWQRWGGDPGSHLVTQGHDGGDATPPPSWAAHLDTLQRDSRSASPQGRAQCPQGEGDTPDLWASKGLIRHVIKRGKLSIYPKPG